MQDPIVITGKLIISQIRIIDITNNDIIKIRDFDRIMSDVIVVRKKVMSRIIVMYGKKLLRKRISTPN
jgi:TolB-like protein